MPFMLLIYIYRYAMYLQYDAYSVSVSGVEILFASYVNEILFASYVNI